MTVRSYRRGPIALLLVALMSPALASCSLIPGNASAPAESSQAEAGTPEDPDLIWRDDFNGVSGAQPDPTHWGYDLGAGGWGNAELQTYTQDPANVSIVGDGTLRIRAVGNAADKTFTSGRLTTRTHVDFTQGTLQARLKLPAGQGVLATFSLVASATADVHNPLLGTIDVAQASADPHKVYTTLHGPKIADPAQQWKVGTSFDQSATVDGNFHTYQVQKTKGQLAFAIDDHVTAIVKSTDLAPTDQWVFDQPFFIVLGVSVGGTVLGPPTVASAFPADMIVDWISLSSKVVT
jgi:beta-glucanase (GH16 family)